MSEMSEEEIRRLKEILERLDASKRAAVLTSENSFMDWLQNAATWLWTKIKDSLAFTYLSDLWRWIFGY